MKNELNVFFAPKSVAVIGATEKRGSVGRSILWNLISSSFGGTVYPVNSKKSSVLGIKAYPSVRAIPDAVDLAVIVVPAVSVSGVIRECGEHGVRGAIIISAGFRETGEAGAALELEALEEARKAHVRLMGPNCLGVMRPINGFNATFAQTVARPGRVGFLSQSGALCTAVLGWSLREQIGFSAIVSTGSMLDIGWGPLIDYLGDDPHTSSIVIYMECVGDARGFLSAAREVALRKPIIVLKAGRTGQAARAAASHTGSLVGSDDVLDAAFRRCGVLRVNNIAEIFNMVEVLARQPRPRGPRLLILTNAGGPGVLATDALLTGGGELATLSEATMEALNGVLPGHWSKGNPIDLIGDAGPERYAKAIEIVSKEPGCDGILAIMTPQGMTSPTEIASELKTYAKLPGKPILASWMGGAESVAGEEILNCAGIPTFAYPDTAVRSFIFMWKYSENLRALYETPSAVEDAAMADARAKAAHVISHIRETGRTILTEAEAKDLLRIYGIPVVETRIAHSAHKANEDAAAIGYPVVLKLHSRTITHKTDVGGVKLDLPDAGSVESAFEEIRAAVTAKVGAQHFEGVSVQPMIAGDGYELILGSSVDAQFGPVLLFGAGGQLVEVFEDRALGIPPLNTTLARRMMEQTKIYRALHGVRGRKPVDLAELERILVRFSQLVVEHPWIKEIDINPLHASPGRLLALDARVILHSHDTAECDLPKPAIRPYPSQYRAEHRMDDGSTVLLRPIRPEDEPLMVAFHGTLSERSVYMRYLEIMKQDVRTAHERLARICFIDYDRQMALVADRVNPWTGLHEIVGVGRLSKFAGANEAEVALLVSDSFQGHGLGSVLMRRLLDFARDEGLDALRMILLSDNQPMRRVAERFGFELGSNESNGTLEACLMLSGRAAVAAGESNPTSGA